MDRSSSIQPHEVLLGWGKILTGKVPFLSIEITRECPLSCPGCYAYSEGHLGAEVTLRDLHDLRGDALVEGVVALVKRHRPMHVSLVGGEPLVRHRELSKILPRLSRRNVFSMVVTSAVIPVPREWMQIPRVRVAVSVDGLPEHHDVRRQPATYERILKNIEDCQVNIHWTITRPMVEREGYLEEYVAFWNARPEVNKIWVSLYTPQVGEQAPEMLPAEARECIARELPALVKRYPKLLMPEGVARTFVTPPATPQECIFAQMSVNYSADLRSRVEPCIFGGDPDCRQCGCAASMGLHWIGERPLVGPLKPGHIMRGSIAVGNLVRRIVPGPEGVRWAAAPKPRAATPAAKPGLVHIKG
jgi:MoaA/NifB/PqqE/SkfB family radical SAM enzyme